MTKATHATFATFQMDQSREAEQRSQLEQVVVPGVRETPGVVDGHWTLDHTTSESLALVTFTSREAAESFAETVRGNEERRSAVGVTLVSVRVLEIAASTRE